LHWCLSSGDDWQLEDGVFDQTNLFRMIIALFEADGNDDGNEMEDGNWASDTLRWWDE
jgi:hypothetical protein